MRHVSTAFRSICFASLVSSAACHQSPQLSPEPLVRPTSPIRQPAESLPLSLTDQEAIYRAALRFYRPARHQVRWLDLRLLPAGARDGVDSLEPQMAERLVRDVGSDHYCIHGRDSACNGSAGGILRVSSVFSASAGRARLLVSFTGVSGPYATGTATSGTEVFFLSWIRDGWGIVAHSPAST
jgi:hypothetical protein